ncbi:hypothetical protein [Streptomyces broussonetiae]|uniref:hypothetical protein n=1 Tax=Streptomyces broussonetiae TaxID=2686304 RepID=UPI0035DA041B
MILDVYEAVTSRRAVRGFTDPVHGAASLRVNHFGATWPAPEERVDRFLVRLVGVPPAEG